ncbi:LPS export ABC transporter periplasmic protein LptC [Psychrobacter frigidicola]|uniref:LPS export ABC transporter periplasmic protein LptC n=1 Tax=Psychrobacter frigidicola TaxID=45611 RepID=A0A5C7AAY5_9GAMM|nr:LPS export ABC transporter periplasmic protein LptC [Psychrobacter frigidicola]TXD98013.1 LPS export ABC transporter periplasmic protein LptC [Psychrobacter frigidicola]
MNTRVLIVLALIIAAIAGWFFQQQGEIAPPVSIGASDVDYEATDIKAVQTNEQGDTEYELNAESLTHNPVTNQDEMSGITMNWEPSDEQRYRIQAGSAAINQQTGELRLSGGFTLASEEKTAATDIEPIKVTGQTLKGNTKSRQVYSDEPVKVEQGMNRFQASSMKANLETGEYEFGQVAVSFTPAERKDKALF